MHSVLENTDTLSVVMLITLSECCCSELVAREVHFLPFSIQVYALEYEGLDVVRHKNCPILHYVSKKVPAFRLAVTSSNSNF